ncbi:MAG: family 16 glycoside hydrolase [Gemmataceae bacterium]
MFSKDGNNDSQGGGSQLGLSSKAIPDEGDPQSTENGNEHLTTPTYVGEEIQEMQVDEDDYFPQRKAVIPLVKGQPHGESRAYDSQKRLIVVEPSVRGIVHGDRITYFPSGKKFGLMHFVNGHVQGTATIWFENGRVATETEMKDGIPDGKQKVYYANGSLSSETSFVGGKRHGEMRHYVPDGRLFAMTQWEDNKQISNNELFEVTEEDYQAILERERFSAVLKDHWKETKEAPRVKQKSTPSKNARTQRNDKWVQLFNGKDLDGWVGQPGVWQVKNEAITATSFPNGRKENTFLCTNREFADFELEFDAQLTGNNNSGVMIRSKLVDADKYWTSGIKVDLGGNQAGWGGLVKYNGQNGGVLRRAGREAATAVRTDDFNHVYIECIGKKIVVKVNDVQVHDTELSELNPSGVISFQLRHTNPTSITIKNIRLREIR